MMAERLAEILAIAKCATDEGYDLSRREMRELLDAIEAAQSRIAQLEAQRGGAVVVPEMPCDDWNRIMHSTDWVPSAMRQVSDWYIANINSIPADRVLADGMVGVDREELATLREIAGRWCPPFGVPHNMETVALFDRLRAQQAKGSV